MGDFDWIVKAIPQGAAVSAVVSVVALILLKYVPTLIKEFRETVQGIVTSHAATCREERELFRGEMKELRTLFSAALRETTEALNVRIDHLTDEVKGLKVRLEK